MNYFNFILFLFINSSTHLINNAEFKLFLKPLFSSSLLPHYTIIVGALPAYALASTVQSMEITTEALLGGREANLHQIPYQVVIIRKTIGLNDQNLAGSGCIVAKNFILTIADCLVNGDGDLGNFEYSIIADAINWKDGGIPMLIDKIFLPGGGNRHVHKIAVTSLVGNLDLDNNPCLNKVKITGIDEIFYGRSGRVSGYGHSQLIYKPSNSNPMVFMRWGARTDHFLRHAEVLVLVNALCALRYTNTNIDTSKQFCGRMINPYDYQPWGLCDNDIGSPLVIDNKVVGLGSRTHYECDDTIEGTIYTKVSAFAPFINSIIDKNVLPDDTVVLNNIRAGRLPAVAPAA